MQIEGWTRPQDALAHALDVLSAPLPDMMNRLSAALSGLVPHVALARLSAMCTYTPLQFSGDPGTAGRVTSAELGRLAERVAVGVPWLGEAELAGAPRPVLAVVSAPEGVEGSALLAVIRRGGEPLDAEAVALAQYLWDLVTTHSSRRTAEAEPTMAASSRAAAAARARTVAELTDAHSSALSAILGTLRTASLDDRTARRGATDLAVAALVEARAGSDLDRALSEEPADAAFGRLTDELRPLLRHTPVVLDLRGPGTRRTLPADVAHAARAAVRGAVLAMLEQDEQPHRLHVSWQLDKDALRAVVRDDGPGRLGYEALAARRIPDRLAALDGRFVLDAVPGWGTTVTVTVPLDGPAERSPAADPLAGLHPREREVLEQLALGRRNRDIAGTLHISESTVKFHVANILGKLGAGSRGEAAALAHAAGLTPSRPIRAATPA